MDHPNAGIDCILWRVHLQRVAVEQNFAFIGRIQAIQDFHECAFSGPIFSEQTMYFTLPHRKRDIVVSHHSWEGLGDIFHSNYFIGAHSV